MLRVLPLLTTGVRISPGWYNLGMKQHRLSIRQPRSSVVEQSEVVGVVAQDQPALGVARMAALAVERQAPTVILRLAHH